MDTHNYWMPSSRAAPFWVEHPYANSGIENSINFTFLFMTGSLGGFGAFFGDLGSLRVPGLQLQQFLVFLAHPIQTPGEVVCSQAQLLCR